MKNRVNITISDETLSQLNWLKTEYMHCDINIPLSQMIAMAVSIAYSDHLIKY